MKKIFSLYIIIIVLALRISDVYAFDLLRPAASSKNTLELKEVLYSGGAIGSEYPLILEGRYSSNGSGVFVLADNRKSKQYEKIFLPTLPMPDAVLENSLIEITFLCIRVDNAIVEAALDWYIIESVRGNIANVILQDNPKNIYGIGTRNVVGISAKLIKKETINPVAFLHEIMHAYLDSRDAETAHYILNKINRGLKPGRRKWIVSKKALNPKLDIHYILRAWQRETFGARDKYLSAWLTDIKHIEESIIEGELFVLGNRHIYIEKLFPMLEAFEESVRSINKPETNALIGQGLSVYRVAYGVKHFENILDIAIVNDAGKKLASIRLYPLRKADAINYDKDAVFLQWLGLHDAALRGHGCGTVLYKALLRFLQELGYSKIYGVPKDYESQGFWTSSSKAEEHIDWRPSDKKIYIPGSHSSAFYVEKPFAHSLHVPAVAGLYEGLITKGSSAGENKSQGMQPQQLNISEFNRTRLLIDQAA